MHRTRILICALLFIAAATLGAQTVQWQHYSYGDFILSSAHHGSTTWIGTSTGLVKYDRVTQEKQILNTANSPLPDNWVSTVAVFPSGTLWIGTPAGFCRVGGDEWQFYNTSNCPFTSNRISKICTAANGTLWALSAGNEYFDYIYRFDGSTWTVFSQTNSTIGGQRISDLTLDPVGNPSLLYYNTSNGVSGLSVWNGSTWISHSAASLGIDSNALNRLVHDGSKVWISPVQGSLYSWDGMTTTEYDLSLEPYNAYQIHTLSVDQEGRLLVSYTSTTTEQARLLRYNGAQWQQLDPNPQVSSLSYPTYVTVDSSGDIWMGTFNGMAVFNGTDWSALDCSNSPLPSNSINYLTVDAQDRVWLSIYDYLLPVSGLMKKDGEDWTFYSTADHPELSHPEQISTDSSGKVWVSCSNSSDNNVIVSFDGTNWNSYGPSNSPLPVGYIECMAVDAFDRLWVAYHDNAAMQTTLYQYNGSQWLTGGSTEHEIRDLVFDSNYVPWMASEAGLLTYDGTDFTLFNTANSGLSNNDVRCLTIDSAHNLWIGMVNGLAKYSSAGQWQIWDSVSSNLPYRTFNDLTVDEWGRIWCATQSTGLLCFNGTDWTSYTTNNSPLLGDQVRNFATDSQQNLWLNGQWNGISRVGLSYSAVDEPTHVPAMTEISLSNYPNPFNPITTVSFTLKEASAIKLCVYNIKGQLVRALDSSAKAAGTHSIVFDGKDDAGRALASGVYYLRITAGGINSSRKILLMK